MKKCNPRQCKEINETGVFPYTLQPKKKCGMKIMLIFIPHEYDKVVDLIE
jgi:hypothetical protein